MPIGTFGGGGASDVIKLLRGIGKEDLSFEGDTSLPPAAAAAATAAAPEEMTEERRSALENARFQLAERKLPDRGSPAALTRHLLFK